jgi:hypothetical protein
MAKIIDISSKLSKDKPVIVIEGKSYEIDDSLLTVMKFEEISGNGGTTGMIEGMKVALGKGAEEIGIEKMRFQNVKVLFLAVVAAMQDISYEEAEARFQSFENAN